MFDYNLVDLILFDWETLKSSYAEYIENYRSLIWLFLATSTATILIPFKKNISIYYYLIPAWVFPGVAFYYLHFGPIYWPSIYLAGICIFTAVLIVAFLIFDKQNHKVSLAQRYLYLLVTVLPFLTSLLMNSEYLISPGGTATVTALGTLTLFFDKKSILSRLVFVFALLWCFIISVFLYTLLFLI